MHTSDRSAATGAAVSSVPPTLVDIEAYLDPYALLRAVRDDSGRIVDFEFVAINRAGCAENGLQREQTVGRTLQEVNPEDFDTGLFDKYVMVVETGEPLVLDDWEYRMRSGQVRYYDVSAVRVADGVGVAWWEVTQRYERDRAVAKGERELRATMDALLDPYDALIAVRDDTGEIVDLEYTRVNEASCRYLRRRPEELIGHRLREVWSGPAADTVFAWGKRVLETGQPLTVDEHEMPLPSGEIRKFDVRGVRVGDVASFTWRDVTSRANAAQLIAESREHYRLLAENASEMVFRTDATGRVTWTSPSVTRVLGWEPDAVMGRPVIEFVHPDDLPQVERELHDLGTAKASTARIELRIASATGDWRWVSVLGRALLDDTGRPAVGVAAMRDIQAQREAQAALEESEERFRRAMTDAAIGIALVGQDGAFLRVNAALCRLTGRDEPDLMGCSWQEITHPADVAADTELLGELLTGERDTYRRSKRYVRPDGQIVWVDLTVSCVRDEDQDVRYFINQVIDITDSVLARQALASSEEHYRLMVENSSDVVFRVSMAGRLEWISPSVTELLGWMPEQLIGRRMFDYLHPDDFPEGLDLSPASEQRVAFEGRCRTSAGPYLWMDVDSRPLLDEAGRLVGRMGRLRDVQAQHDAQEALRVSERRFRTAMESAPTGMAVVGLDREFVQVNPALCRLLGRSEQWLLTHTLTDVLDPLDDELDRGLRAQLLAGQTSSLSRDHQMIRSDGERLVVEQSTGLLCDDSGQATAYVSQFADVTEARATREQLRFLATHDSLTELLNRRELVTRISGVLARRQRTGVNVGVLFIDLDGLKPINDTYGHAVGDEVIVTVARRIRAQVRSNDILARFGGDEFVLVLPALRSGDDATRIAAGLHAAVELPMPIEGHEIGITLSIGVAVVTPGQDPDVALRQADTALYRAKREGRARTARYDPVVDGA